jgi:putative two-component system response regulator
LADVFDALICKRVYKSAMSFAEAVEIITRDSGSHFDPDIVQAFIENLEQFKAIAETYRE